MRIKYTVLLEVQACYECEDVGKLKDNFEYGETLAHFICDEIATAGGVGSYDIKRSCIEAIT